MRKSVPIAALYVETNGAYYGLPGVDPWDEERDARLYVGPHPVVAHPPCQRWGKFWAGQPLWIKRTGERKKKGEDGGCFAAALAAVRKWGGVLEHPWQSHAWPYFGLNVPPRKGGWIVADSQGGWTCCVEQGRYGHYARKPTMLYAVGVDLPELDWGESEARLDPEVVARMGLKRAKRLGEVGSRGGGQNSTPRIHTPTPFRELLIAMARTASSSKQNVAKEEINLATFATDDYKESTNLKTTNKENCMSFELRITGGDAAELAQQAITFAFLLAPNLREKAQSPSVLDEAVQAVEAEIVEEPKKPARRARKAETIEHDANEGVKADVHAAIERNDRQRDAGPADDGPEVSTETPVETEPAEPEIETAAEEKAEEPAMTIDELRKFVIGEYLNTCFESQPDRTAAFRELLKPFKLEKLGELPADKIGEFKAVVDAKIAEKLAA